MKKKALRSLTLLTLLAAAFSVTAWAVSVLVQEDEQVVREPATPVQMGVMTEKEKIHSKLFKGYIAGQKISGLTRTQATNIEVEVELPSGPFPYGNPNAPAAPHYPHGFLRGIACDADAIAIGTLKSKSSQLTEDGAAVFTSYEMDTEDVLKSNTAASIAPSGRLTVVRLGGAILLNGKNVRVKVPSFKSFRIGNRYVLFLRHVPETGAYKAFSNGSFQIYENRIERLTNRALWDKLNSEKDAAAFIAEVRAAVASPCGDTKLL